MAALTTRLLKPLGSSLERIGRAMAQDLAWDPLFDSWIETAKREGIDPNDVGDREWGSPAEAIERRYGPHLSADKVVLELGPGSGRYTRHLLKRCSRMVLVDASPQVVRWLKQYLRDRSNCEVFLAQDCSLSFVRDSSVDVATANGVFEHLSTEAFYLYLRAFIRVLRPGGVAVLNFDDFQSAEGFAWFKKWLPPDGSRGIFRFYHPEMVRLMCEDVGFAGISIAPAGRMAWLTCTKPGSP
jgi:SAM-dependent methyltransferase